MGQSQAAEVREFQHNYEYQYNGVDPDYGQISVYQKRISHDLFAVVKRPLNKEEDIVKRMQLIKQRRSVLFHPNCVHVVGSHYQPAFDFCGEVNMLYLLIEYIPNNILKDIHYRRNKKFIYTEGEVWYFIKSIVDALTFYNQQAIEYFDLHPGNVRLNDNGIIKLMDLSLHEQPLPSTMKIQLGLRPFEYLAPEQIQSLDGKAQLNQEKINIYCLGVMCIQIILRIETCTDLFEGNKLSYSYERLHQYYQKQSISLALQNLINEMIREQPSERLSYSDVLNFVSLQTATKVYNHLRPSSIFNYKMKAYQVESSQTSRIEQPVLEMSKVDISRTDISKVSQRSQQQQQQQQQPNDAQRNRLFLNSVDPTQSILYPIQEIKTPVQDIRSVIKPQLIDSEPKNQDSRSSPANKIFTNLQPSPTNRNNQQRFYPSPPQIQTQQVNIDFTEIDQLINKALQKSQDAFARYGKPELAQSSQQSLHSSVVIDSPGQQQSTAQFYSAQKYIPTSYPISQIQVAQASKNSSIVQPFVHTQSPNTRDQSTIMQSRIKDAIQEAEAELEKSKMLSNQLKLTVN